MRSNCIVFAVRRYARLWGQWVSEGKPKGRTPGIVLRPSDLKPEEVQHWIAGWWRRGSLTMEDAQSFAPLNTEPLPWWLLWQALWCEGYIRYGDLPPEH